MSDKTVKCKDYEYLCLLRTVMQCPDNKECPNWNPPTNADKIRAMTDEQLAIYIESLVIFCLGDESLRNTERRLRWLKQEADR